MNDDLQLQSYNHSLRNFHCLKNHKVSTISLYNLEVPVLCYKAEFSEIKGQ